MTSGLGRWIVVRWRRFISLALLMALAFNSCVSVELQRPGIANGKQPVGKPGETMAGTWHQTTRADFEAGTQYKTKVVDVGDGAVALDNSKEGTFTSAVEQADFVFNAVGAVQSSQLPQGASVDLEIRTSANGKNWSDWRLVHARAPSDQEKDDAESQVIAVKPGRYLQYRAILSTSGDASPVIEKVAVTYIGSTAGPNLEQAKRAVLPKGPGQPTIISREGWGANEKLRFDRNGKEVWPAEYRKPQKLVIHHTLTPNDETNGPALVRAVYYYHTVTLGWGDIGYNYLVDAAGNIYEGRRGDGVVAGHAYGHNYGSIGIAVLGDYGTTQLSDPARKALVGLLAWLSTKYGIDPQGKSFFVDRVLPNIYGHRDSNQTTCPGNNLYTVIPQLRKTVFASLPVPEVKFESPAEGASISRPTVVKLSQQDKWALAKVQYIVDDATVATLAKPDWTWQLDPSKYPEGQHTLKAVVTTTLGKQASITRNFLVGKPPASTWYFAEGSTSPGYQTWLSLMNANLAPAKVYATFYDEAGKTERREFQVAPKSRLNVSVNQILPNHAVSIKLDSDQAIYAERAMYFGHDGHTSTGARSTAKTWYFAEGSTDVFFDTWLLVMNPNDAPAKLSVTYYKSDGSVVNKDYTATPMSRLNIWVNKEVPSAAVSMKVESDLPVVAERSMYFDQGRGGHNTLGATAPAPNWYFAEGSGGPDFNTWILLLNPNADAAQAKLTYMRENGPVESTTVMLPPRTRTNVWVNKIVAQGAVATKVEANKPIVAERSMYWSGNRAGHNTLGATAPANQWFLPDGKTADGFNEWILVLNPNAEAARVTITFLDEKGEATAKTYDVAGNSRFNVWANKIVQGAAISTLVQSDRPVVVERSSYFNDNAGGTNSMGIPR